VTAAGAVTPVPVASAFARPGAAAATTIKLQASASARVPQNMPFIPFLPDRTAGAARPGRVFTA
jgi:hypothetical protein